MSGSKPSTSSRAPTPDLSWFCCICCARRPMPHASFSMLLTTCSHIVCSSCWNRSRNGECPKCQVKANTLNLSTAKELPKQLEPYYKSPVELIKQLLAACEFQEFQKRQMLERRKVAWVIINHQRAKEDFEREYAECKQLMTALNERKRAIKHLSEKLRRKGIDPIQALSASGKVSALDVSRTFGVLPSPGYSTPSTPFLTTPLARPPSTSTPAFPGVNPPTVEFVEPKKLPHTMRGSVTSKAVRRSPSNPPTPVSKPPFTHNTGNVLPAKRPRATTPVLIPHQPRMGQQQVSRSQPMGQSGHSMGQPIMHSGQPMLQSGHPIMRPITPMGPSPIQLGRPILSTKPQPMGQSVSHFSQPTVQSGQPIAHSGQTITQYGQPMARSGKTITHFGQPAVQSGQPIAHSGQTITQYGQPVARSGKTITHFGQPAVQSGRPTAHSGQTTTQFGQPTMQYGQPTAQTTTQFGQPTMQYGQPTAQTITQFGQPTMQSGRPAAIQPMIHSGQQVTQPVIPPRRPIQSGHIVMQHQQPPSLPNQATRQQQSMGHSDSIRVRAVPPSSVPQRIFPSPMSTRSSQSTHTPSQRTTPVGGQRGSTGVLSRAQTSASGRISLPPQSHTHPASQGPQHSPRGRIRTPTNPSPLLQAFSTPQSSPWQQGRSSQGSGSPWKPGCTPPPGMRLSTGGYVPKGPRLTPMKS